MKIVKGGVTKAKGFEAAGVEANIKYQGRTDMAIRGRRIRILQRYCGCGSERVGDFDRQCSSWIDRGHRKTASN